MPLLDHIETVTPPSDVINSQQSLSPDFITTVAYSSPEHESNSAPSMIAFDAGAKYYEQGVVMRNSKIQKLVSYFFSIFRFFGQNIAAFWSKHG